MIPRRARVRQGGAGRSRALVSALLAALFFPVPAAEAGGAAPLEEAERVIVLREGSSPVQGIRLPRGEEGMEPEPDGRPRDVYILRMERRAVGREIEMLRLQRAILANQLALLRAVNAAAVHQRRVDSRTARTEAAARDMTLGMRAQAAETDRLRGETASTGARVIDIARTTNEMAATVEKIRKQIRDLDGAIKDMEIDFEQLGRAIGDMGDVL
ncbi:MAG: hypothetical protein PHN82_05540 [bacterium]|nr:hypothetical protein [bacterium]